MAIPFVIQPTPAEIPIHKNVHATPFATKAQTATIIPAHKPAEHTPAQEELTITFPPPPTKHITLAEAHARVKKAKTLLIQLQKAYPEITSKRELAEAEFTKRKREFVELYANKTEQLNLQENECYEASNSSIVVTVKGIVRHNIQFGKMVCATYSEKRTALAKEHDEELRTLVKACVRDIYSHSTKNLRLAQNCLEQERALLRAVQKGTPYGFIKPYDEVAKYVIGSQSYTGKDAWKQSDYSAINRAVLEYQKYCKFEDLDTNWAHDVLRPKEALAAIETIKQLVEDECPSMKLINGTYYSIGPASPTRSSVRDALQQQLSGHMQNLPDTSKAQAEKARRRQYSDKSNTTGTDENKRRNETDTSEQSLKSEVITLAQAQERVRIATLAYEEKEQAHAGAVVRRNKAEMTFKKLLRELAQRYSKKEDQLEQEERVRNEGTQVTKDESSSQLEKTMNAESARQRAALIEEHDEELRKLIAKSVADIYSGADEDARVARAILSVEGRLLLAIENGASTSQLKAIDDHSKYVQSSSRTNVHKALTRAAYEYRSRAKGGNKNINWEAELATLVATQNRKVYPEFRMG